MTRDTEDTGHGGSIHEVVRLRADTHYNTPVLFAPKRKPLTWGSLGTQIDEGGKALARLGTSRTDRIAVVLPDGPELAMAFLTISASAIFAPLNSAYRAADFEFYLNDLQPKMLILAAGEDSPARVVARKLNIPIVELETALNAPAGQFKLKSEANVPSSGAVQMDWAGPDDIGLVLHTSATTSRPKMVHLTHRNLCSSGSHIARTLELTAGDRGLCVMPLFHIHGLVGSLFSSIVAGASVVCSPKFSALNFFEWLDEFKPTWYSAVPTMHQAILAHASRHTPIIENSPLRLIRSSSSALPPQVMRGLEEVFSAPVIESYGMTEASHQIASNPLPPSVRKPGSVGRAAGPEVAVMNEAGHLLEPSQTGEIVIRGPNVTAGYGNNPSANAIAFMNGWFRTGDQGYFDSDGYLCITGRLKELINRGGEKIAPREIDEVLLDHTAVREAVAFAVPHPTLGEDIAAAVVLKEGAACTEAELRDFVLERLPLFKAPTRIVLVSDVPKGPTGKIQRTKLASRLAGALAMNYEAPVSGTETLVSKTIGTVLDCPEVGRHDNFFALGGDSLRAVQVMSRLSQKLGIEIPLVLLFRFPTPALLTLELDRRIAELDVTSLAAELEKLAPEEISRLLGDSFAKSA